MQNHNYSRKFANSIRTRSEPTKISLISNLRMRRHSSTAQPSSNATTVETMPISCTSRKSAPQEHHCQAQQRLLEAGKRFAAASSDFDDKILPPKKRRISFVDSSASPVCSKLAPPAPPPCCCSYCQSTCASSDAPVSYLQTPADVNNIQTNIVDAIDDAHPKKSAPSAPSTHLQSPPISPPDGLKSTNDALNSSSGSSKQQRHLSRGLLHLMQKESARNPATSDVYLTPISSAPSSRKASGAAAAAAAELASGKDIEIDVKGFDEKRSALVEDVIDFCNRFSFHSETSWLAVTFLDKFMLKKQFKRRKQLKLLCAGVVYLASKIEEELLEPNVGDVVELFCGGSARRTRNRYDDDNDDGGGCGDNYDALSGLYIGKSDILRMEKMILNILNWDLSSAVTPHAFVCEFLIALERHDFTIVLMRLKPLFDFLSSHNHLCTFKFHSFSVAVGCFETLYGAPSVQTRSMSEEMDSFKLFVEQVLDTFPDFANLFFVEIEKVRSVIEVYEAG